jgi:hypothetical protein
MPDQPHTGHWALVQHKYRPQDEEDTYAQLKSYIARGVDPVQGSFKVKFVCLPDSPDLL